MVESRLGLDLDNVLARTESHMRGVQRAQGKLLPGHFEPLTADGILNPEYYDARQSYLRDSTQIHRLPFYPGAILAMRILRKHFDVHINTARREDQRSVLQGLFSARGISQYVSSLLLRPVEVEDPESAKLQNAQAAGINYVVEDSPRLALSFAEAGNKVILIRRIYNNWILNSPNIRVYGRVLDFALDLEYYGSPEKLFAAHLREISNPRDLHRALHRVHRVGIFAA